MSARATTIAGARSKRRWTTFAWIAGTSLVIIALLYTEQIALLYVLATLGVTVLLLIVARADLGGAQQPFTEPRPADDSAALGDNLLPTRRADDGNESQPCVFPSRARKAKRR